MNIELLEWIGALTGIVGAGLLALNIPASRWGFCAYLISNVCWIVFGLKTNAYGLMMMQTAFMATTLLGICRWFRVSSRGPALRLARMRSG